MAQPWFQYDVSRLQSITKCANVSQLKYCNDILSEAKEQAELGLYYKVSAFNWNDLIILSVGDASWAGDEKIVEDKVSQGGASAEGLPSWRIQKCGTANLDTDITLQANPVSSIEYVKAR